MSTIPHDPSRTAPETRSWPAQLLVREMWAALAIAFMWPAVLFAAVSGSDIVSTNAEGNSTNIPSAVAVAIFALFGTRVVAKYGFGQRPEDGD
jgi:hypothetical protein